MYSPQMIIIVENFSSHTPCFFYTPNLLFLPLLKKLWNAFFELFLPWIKISGRVFQFFFWIWIRKTSKNVLRNLYSKAKFKIWLGGGVKRESWGGENRNFRYCFVGQINYYSFLTRLLVIDPLVPKGKEKEAHEECVYSFPIKKIVSFTRN
jgi:hypothetical protein